MNSMRHLAYVPLFILAGFAAPALAEVGFADHYRAAVIAYREGDAPAFLRAARSARELRPDSPQAAYLLAAASAMNGGGEEALDLLQELASQELFYEPGDEPAFVSLGLADRRPDLLARFASHGEPQGEVSVAFRLDEDRFVPEGIAWDAQTQRFLLGSIHQARVLAVDTQGQAGEFITSGTGGLLSVFGMQIQASRRSLWIATAGLRETQGIDELWMGRAGLLEFDLDTGRPRRAFWLPEDGREHVLGDLQLVEGGALTTDSLTGEVLQLEFDTGSFEIIVPAGVLVSPQGLVLADDTGFVFVADYRGGIFRLSLEDGVLNKLAEGGTTHHGIDGLYRRGEWLVAIQNGVRPNRVVALKLNAGETAVEDYRVLAAALPDFDDPNLGVIVNKHFHFIANSHWPQFDEQGGVPHGLSGPVVMSVELP